MAILYSEATRGNRLQTALQVLQMLHERIIAEAHGHTRRNPAKQAGHAPPAPPTRHRHRPTLHTSQAAHLCEPSYTTHCKDKRVYFIILGALCVWRERTNSGAHTLSLTGIDTSC
jgi:hypothetical protein